MKELIKSLCGKYFEDLCDYLDLDRLIKSIKIFIAIVIIIILLIIHPLIFIITTILVASVLMVMLIYSILE